MFLRTIVATLITISIKRFFFIFASTIGGNIFATLFFTTLIIVDKKPITLTCFIGAIQIFLGLYVVILVLPYLQKKKHSFLKSNSLQLMLHQLLSVYMLMACTVFIFFLLNYLVFWRIFSHFGWYVLLIFILYVLEGTMLCSLGAILVALLPQRNAQLVFAICYVVIFHIYEIFEILTSSTTISYSLKKVLNLLLPDTALFDLSNYIIYELPCSIDMLLFSILYLFLYNALYFELTLYLWHKKSLHTNRNPLV